MRSVERRGIPSSGRGDDVRVAPSSAESRRCAPEQVAGSAAGSGFGVSAQPSSMPFAPHDFNRFFGTTVDADGEHEVLYKAAR
jgi:hypothetical protein